MGVSSVVLTRPLTQLQGTDQQQSGALSFSLAGRSWDAWLSWRPLIGLYCATPELYASWSPVQEARDPREINWEMRSDPIPIPPDPLLRALYVHPTYNPTELSHSPTASRASEWAEPAYSQQSQPPALLRPGQLSSPGQLSVNENPPGPSQSTPLKPRHGLFNHKYNLGSLPHYFPMLSFSADGVEAARPRQLVIIQANPRKALL